MSAAAIVWIQHLLPQRLLGSVVRALASTRIAWIRRPLISWFARRYAVDLGEAARSGLNEYVSFNDFFTRELRADARPLAAGETTLVSPADGRVTQYGSAPDGRALQAKGLSYALEELLGEPPRAAQRTRLDSFLTVYLAPRNYHRVHLPLAGTLIGLRHVPGRRFSVNAATTHRIPRLFCRNERAIVWFATDAGPLAVVLVGALNVAGISTPWLGELHGRVERFWDGAALPTARQPRGVEIGRFNLGSTVIVVLPGESVAWDTTLEVDRPVRMGERLGSIIETR